MTDLEISKALALAIGWKSDQVAFHDDMWEIMVQIEMNPCGWRVFNYRDWNVIGPIAEKYKMFPQPYMNKWNVRGWSDTIADTPQKAIALTVIGAKK